MIKREPYGVSSNEVAEFVRERRLYLNALREAITWTEEADNDFRSGEELDKAVYYKNLMNASYNRANNAGYRTHALVAEVKALRSGQGVTYGREEDDPTRDDFAVRICTENG